MSAPLLGRQGQQVPDQVLDRDGQRGGWLIGEDIVGDPPPELVDDIQFGTGRGQPAQLDGQLPSQMPAGLGPVNPQPEGLFRTFRETGPNLV